MFGETNVTVTFSTLPLNVLDAIGFQTNWAFKLCLEGEAGKNYKVLAKDSLDAINWSELGVMESTNGIWRYQDATAINSTHRFYRTLQLP